MKRRPIKDWAEDDRPREKLFMKGSEALSNSELLAILINTGSAGVSAVDLARELLDRCNNKLKELSQLTVRDILDLGIPGIGLAKAVAINAALALNNRRAVERVTRVNVLNLKDIASYMYHRIAFLKYEVFAVGFMDATYNIKGHVILSIGGLTETTVDTRLVLRHAIQNNAIYLALAHNHPSGDPHPSDQDRLITKEIERAALLMRIPVLEHVIFGINRYFSFHANGLLLVGKFAEDSDEIASAGYDPVGGDEVH